MVRVQVFFAYKYALPYFVTGEFNDGFLKDLLDCISLADLGGVVIWR